MVTPRILETRRLGVRPHPQLLAPRHRRSALPLLEIAGAAAVERLGRSVFTRICAAATVFLVLALAYLVLAAQATQSAYVVGQLKDQNAQLQAEHQALQYRSVSLHGPAQAEQVASATGMQRSTNDTNVPTQPVALDLQKPIGPDQPDTNPPWQRALAAVFGGRDGPVEG